MLDGQDGQATQLCCSKSDLEQLKARALQQNKASVVSHRVPCHEKRAVLATVLAPGLLMPKKHHQQCIRYVIVYQGVCADQQVKPLMVRQGGHRRMCKQLSSEPT